MATVEALGLGEKGIYLLAATFGNVHGVYKPGNVKLRPEILKQGQDVRRQAGPRPPADKPFDLVFHGGSGSLLEEIREALSLRRREDERRHRHPVRVHPADRRSTCSSNYDGVLKIDGEVGNKKVYDPRSYMKTAETGHGRARRAGLRGPAVRPGQSTAG